jgi:hypothetical protein
MRHRPLILLAMTVPLASIGVWSCLADEGRVPAPAVEATDGSAGGPLADVTPRAFDAEAPSGAMRIAHMAPRLGNVDFCYRPAGDARFVGPVLTGASDAGAAPDAAADATVDAAPADGAVPDAGDAGAIVDAGPDARDAAAVDAGGDAGLDAGLDATADAGDAATGDPLAPFAVTTYVGVKGSGTFEIAIVAAGAGTCQSPLRTGQVTLDPGKLTTVVVAERSVVDAGPATVLLSLTDNPVVAEDRVRARVVHAAFGTAQQAAPGDLSVAVAGGTSPVVAAAVSPGGVTRARVDGPPVDPFGYAEIPPVASLAAIRVTELREGGVTWTSAFVDLGLAPSSIKTAYIAQAEANVVLVLCDDKATAGRRTACRTLPVAP